MGTPRSAGSGCTFLPVPRSERVRPSDFRSEASRRAEHPEGGAVGRGYPASTRKGRWRRAPLLVSVGKPLPLLVRGPVPAPRRLCGESAHPPGCSHRSPLGGGGSALSSVRCPIDPSRRRGCCALVEAGWERRPQGATVELGGKGTGRPEARATRGPPLCARSRSASERAFWWTRGSRGRAPLGRCSRCWGRRARGPAALRCGHPQK